MFYTFIGDDLFITMFIHTYRSTIACAISTTTRHKSPDDKQMISLEKVTSLAASLQSALAQGIAEFHPKSLAQHLVTSFHIDQSEAMAIVQYLLRIQGIWCKPSPTPWLAAQWGSDRLGYHWAIWQLCTPE